MRTGAWLVLIASAFGAGAIVRRTFADEPARSAVGVGADRGPEAARDEILGILEQQYFRTVDEAQYAGHPVADLATTLDDPYTRFLTAGQYREFLEDESSNAVGLGISVAARPDGLLVQRVFAGSPADAAGIQVGDVVTSVAGSSLVGLSLRDALQLLRGNVGEVKGLSIRRHGFGVVAEVEYRPLSEWMVHRQILTAGGHKVGDVALYEFGEGSGALVRAAVRDLLAQGADRLVLDLRDNPGGWAREAMRVAEVFLPNDSVVLTERSVHEGETTYRTHADPLDVTTPLIVLVDGSSASSAEIVTGALHDNLRARVVGARTFGKGRIQEVAPLSTGGALKYTIAEYLTPSGFALDRKGIEPDVPIASWSKSDQPLAAALMLLASAD